MSREDYAVKTEAAGFPRTRGDEPYTPGTVEYSGTFSPHARG